MSVAIGYNLGVSISSPANGEQLVYNSATGLWENGTPAGGGDMLASVYDTTADGKVDTSNDVSDSPLITRTSLASSGGLLINIDSATGDIARTTDGFIEDEKYGVYFDSNITNASGEFDTAVLRTGTKTLKLSATNATGRAFATLGLGTTPGASISVANIYKYCFPMKASTKYKLSCWVKTFDTLASSTYFSLDTYNTSGTRQTTTASAFMPVGTNDWTLLTVSITSGASVAFGNVSCIGQLVAGNISDAWFDINSMTLEEVVEPVANSLTSPSPSLVSFTAVGSTDNIDQSLDTGGAAAFTYVPLTAITELAVDRQTFVPTKSKVTRIGVWVVNKGTGNWTLTVHDASNVVQATATIANASLTNGAFNYFNVPCNVTALASYHFHVTSTVLDGNLKSGVTLDMEGASYIENYYKPTTNFKASQNNSTMQISADEDGFLDGSVINVVNGTYSFAKTYINNVTELGKNDNLSFTSSGGSLLDGPTSGLPISPTTFGLNSITYKINGVLPLSSIVLSITSGVPATRSFKVQYSTDNSSYTDLYTYTNADNLLQINTTVPLSGVTVFYLKFVAITNICYIRNFLLSASIDTSSLSRTYNYPTNKDIIKQYSTTLGSASTSATYRATKWGFPAIEYSATEYQYLDIDTTATGSVVKFSEDGTSFTTVADGANIALTSTTTPLVYVSHNITANRLYLSSNDYNASSDKDGSNLQTVVYQVQSQGLKYYVEEMQATIDRMEQAIYALQNP